MGRKEIRLSDHEKEILRLLVKVKSPNIPINKWKILYQYEIDEKTIEEIKLKIKVITQKTRKTKKEMNDKAIIRNLERARKELKENKVFKLNKLDDPEPVIHHFLDLYPYVLKKNERKIVINRIESWKKENLYKFLVENNEICFDLDKSFILNKEVLEKSNGKKVEEAINHYKEKERKKIIDKKFYMYKMDIGGKNKIAFKAKMKKIKKIEDLARYKRLKNRIDNDESVKLVYVPITIQTINGGHNYKRKTAILIPENRKNYIGKKGKKVQEKFNGTQYVFDRVKNEPRVYSEFLINEIKRVFHPRNYIEKKGYDKYYWKEKQTYFDFNEAYTYIKIPIFSKHSSEEIPIYYIIEKNKENVYTTWFVKTINKIYEEYK